MLWLNLSSGLTKEELCKHEMAKLKDEAVASKFQPKNDQPQLSLFWLAAKAASKLDVTNPVIPQECGEAIEAARPYNNEPTIAAPGWCALL